MKFIPLRSRTFSLFLLAVALSPRPMRAVESLSAPPAPDQTIFSPSDDATAAYDKIMAAMRTSQSHDAAFQAACRDFCTKFPDDPHYFAIRRNAIVYWPFFRGGPVKNWDATDGDHDPKLNADKRADLAMLIVNAKVVKNFRPNHGTFDEAEFDAIVAALPPYRNTKVARDQLITSALKVAPEKAIPKLRELYPFDPKVAACVRLLESIGQPCEFQFTALDGRKIDSHDYRGKVVVLDFWAKGCGPCLALMPDLKRMAESLGSDGFAVIGINMDDNRADAESVITKFGLTWPEHFDGKGWKNEMAARFMVSSIPTCAVIDRQGILRFMGHGPTHTEVRKRIDALLAEKPTGAKIASMLGL